MNDSTIPGASPIASPDAVSRLNWYGQTVSSFPYARFGGSQGYFGDNNVYNVYLGYYNQLVTEESPFQLDLSFTINDEGNFVLNAEVEVTQTIQTLENKIFFVLTYHNNTNYSSTVVAKSVEVPLDITQIGQSSSFNEIIERDLNWNVTQLKTVAVIQSWNDQSILQAEQVGFEGLIPSFEADITSGPASMSVDFISSSLPLSGIESWNWDFDGDGVFDSQIENPTYLYDTPGIFDVTLVISDGTETRQLTWEDYIEVNSTQTASGQIAGYWRNDLSPYTLADSVFIAEGKELIIDPGVVINCALDSQLNIQGCLIAGAHNGDPIIITSTTSWKGITFLDTEMENDLINCHISQSSSCALKIENSAVNLSDSKIFDCFSDDFAAAIYIHNSPNVLIQGNLISNNNGTDFASIIYVSSSNPDIKNNIIVNNTSESFGSIELDTGSNAYLQNNTISHNFSGIASLRIKDSFPIIRNCIIWEGGNLLSLENGMPVISYSCVFGGYTGNGNVGIDPLFVNPSDGIGSQFSGINANWILGLNSPCVDAGNPDEIYNDIEDINNPGYALFPARGTLNNDMGAFGGIGNGYYDIVGIDENLIVNKHKITLSNYPNPFNPSTTISFSAHENTERIEIIIYNLKGQKVKMYTFLNGGFGTREQSVIWNGDDENGETVSSGIYLYRIKSGDFVKSNKMLLLK